MQNELEALNQFSFSVFFRRSVAHFYFQRFEGLVQNSPFPLFKSDPECAIRLNIGKRESHKPQRKRRNNQPFCHGVKNPFLKMCSGQLTNDFLRDQTVEGIQSDKL